jgi:hypothetical protein
LVLLLAAVRPEPLPAGRFGASAFALLAVETALNDQTFAAFIPGSIPSGQNAIPVDGFDWTNHSRRLSSGASFSQWMTNR